MCVRISFLEYARHTLKLIKDCTRKNNVLSSVDITSIIDIMSFDIMHGLVNYYHFCQQHSMLSLLPNHERIDNCKCMQQLGVQCIHNIMALDESIHVGRATWVPSL